MVKALRGHDDHGIVRNQASQPEHRRFQVLFMATQVNNLRHFKGLVDNLSPIFVFVLIEPLRQNLCTVFIVPDDFVRYGGGSSVFCFMGVVENFQSRETSAVV